MVTAYIPALTKIQRHYKVSFNKNITMKQDLLKIQMSKCDMNKLRGGALAITTCLCHCNTSGETLAFEVSAESDDILDAKMQTGCKEAGYSCEAID